MKNPSPDNPMHIVNLIRQWGGIPGGCIYYFSEDKKGGNHLYIYSTFPIYVKDIIWSQWVTEETYNKHITDFFKSLK